MENDITPFHQTYGSNSASYSLPEIIWTYEATSDAMRRSRLMYRALRAWNFGHKHGFKLHDVMYFGKPLTLEQVELCNMWIQGGGAATAQNLEHWEAIRLFEKIIHARPTWAQPVLETLPAQPLIENKPTLDLPM